jgi:hypothetical protein
MVRKYLLPAGKAVAKWIKATGRRIVDIVLTIAAYTFLFVYTIILLKTVQVIFFGLLWTGLTLLFGFGFGLGLLAGIFLGRTSERAIHRKQESTILT